MDAIILKPEMILTLPLEAAILLAVEENIERDKREGVLDSCDYEVVELYETEARLILIANGENYLPDYQDHHVIKLEGWIEQDTSWIQSY